MWQCYGMEVDYCTETYLMNFAMAVVIIMVFIVTVQDAVLQIIVKQALVEQRCS